MELKITDEKVRAIAEKHPAMKDTLKEVFPEAFPSEYVEFKEGQKLGEIGIDHGPVIGTSAAPNGMRNKCLIWDAKKFDLEVGKYAGLFRSEIGYIAFKKLK